MPKGNFTTRGKRPRLDPNEPTVTKYLSLPASDWAKLEQAAAELSRREHIVVTPQEVIRRALKVSMSRVIARIAEGHLLKKMASVFREYGVELRPIPRYKLKEQEKQQAAA